MIIGNKIDIPQNCIRFCNHGIDQLFYRPYSNHSLKQKRAIDAPLTLFFLNEMNCDLISGLKSYITLFILRFASGGQTKVHTVCC